ncbi:unnamed protein product [Gongylonema pulchrum]|uniref:Uncharacterized protein n=1 Tax=Gongylonema pulchrum TaxID=637853 RepID=A0A183E031_9BILA|nr:unnamed protein product [Gongylonema pulchrum]
MEAPNIAAPEHWPARIQSTGSAARASAPRAPLSCSSSHHNSTVAQKRTASPPANATRGDVKCALRLAPQRRPYWHPIRTAHCSRADQKRQLPEQKPTLTMRRRWKKKQTDRFKFAEWETPAHRQAAAAAAARHHIHRISLSRQGKAGKSGAAAGTALVPAAATTFKCPKRCRQLDLREIAASTGARLHWALVLEAMQ